MHTLMHLFVPLLKRCSECASKVFEPSPCLRHSNRARPCSQPASHEGRGPADGPRQRRDATRAPRGLHQEEGVKWAKKTCGTQTSKPHRKILLTVGNQDIVKTRINHISTSTPFFLWATAPDCDCAQKPSVRMSKQGY